MSFVALSNSAMASWLLLVLFCWSAGALPQSPEGASGSPELQDTTLVVTMRPSDIPEPSAAGQTSHALAPGFIAGIVVSSTLLVGMVATLIYFARTRAKTNVDEKRAASFNDVSLNKGTTPTPEPGAFSRVPFLRNSLWSRSEPPLPPNLTTYIPNDPLYLPKDALDQPFPLHIPNITPPHGHRWMDLSAFATPGTPVPEHARFAWVPDSVNQAERLRRPSFMSSLPRAPPSDAASLSESHRWSPADNESQAGSTGSGPSFDPFPFVAAPNAPPPPPLPAHLKKCETVPQSENVTPSGSSSPARSESQRRKRPPQLALPATPVSPSPEIGIVSPKPLYPIGFFPALPSASVMHPIR
ncbi:hypothetical protein BJ742DRAFT_786468 [Cladochytrium replicatum]|nr:hypothetical protein BJ742DRAFT_786468 [Cladochytrium replicatum]